MRIDYEVLVQGPVDAWSPLAARVYVGWVDPATEKTIKLPLPVQTTAGEQAAPFVATVYLESRNAESLDCGTSIYVTFPDSGRIRECGDGVTSLDNLQKATICRQPKPSLAM